MGLTGRVTRKDAVGGIQDFIKRVSANNHGIKILAIALMAHGEENDKWVF